MAGHGSVAGAGRHRFRLLSTSSRPPTGLGLLLGLGLALAKGFVEGMGGTLEAEDTPGGGLTMVVDLKVAA